MTTVLGRYELQGKLGQGGMAEIWLARTVGPSGFAKQVVVKRVTAALSGDPTVEELFRTEARLAGRLDHPNLLHVFDFGQEADGALVLVMELVDGASLRAVVAALRKGQVLDVRIAAKVMALVCEGLHAAHELRDENGVPMNLVHRDISPENLLLARSGAVKVADFGIARIERKVQLTAPDAFRGKIGYASPEQIVGETVTRSADIWACGVTLFELLTAQRPFHAETEAEMAAATLHREPRSLRSLRADAQAELEAIIARCLEKKPEARFATAHELSEALEHFVSWTGKPLQSTDLGNTLEALGIKAHTVSSSGTPLLEGESLTKQAFFETNEFKARSALAIDGSLHQLEAEPTPGEQKHEPLLTPAPEEPAIALGSEPMSERSARYAKLELETDRPVLQTTTELPDVAVPARSPVRAIAGVALAVLLLIGGVVAVRRFMPQPVRKPGSLFIESSPAGATVLFNGNTVGETPWAGDNPATSGNVVTLRRSGYRDTVLRFDGGVSWSGTAKLEKAR